MKNRLILWAPLLAALLWLVAQHAAANGIYVWKGEDGTVHYGDSAAIGRADAPKAKRIRSTSMKNSVVITSNSFTHKPTKSSRLPIVHADSQITITQDKEEAVASKNNEPEQQNTLHENEKINPAVYNLLNNAKQYSQAGQHARAAAIVERALRLQSDHPKTWQYLAKIYHQQGRYKQAYFLKQKARQISGY